MADPKGQEGPATTTWTALILAHPDRRVRLAKVIREISDVQESLAMADEIIAMLEAREAPHDDTE